MGIFPEDFEINVMVLTKLWVAEGILKPACSKTLEGIGEEYFLDLLQRSLVMVQEKGSNGKIKTCRIHDLLWDLCVREAQKEKFFCVTKGSLYDIQEGTSICRVSNMTQCFLYFHAAKGTLERDDKTLSSSVVQSCSLKVLHNEDYYRLLDGMDEMVNIRYIYSNGALSIASIYKLRNLQTIVFPEYWKRDMELSPEIWKMPQLRHVKFHSIYLPRPPCSEIKEGENSIVVLENLQTLSSIRNFSWTEEVLKRIPNLQKLAIYYDYETAADWEEHCVNNLGHLNKLESLCCCIEYTLPNLVIHFTFLTSLRKLTLYGFNLHPF
ncbi:Putative late blight resistance protein homolog R1B-12 [Olea europaea subsp. europaea]|uniref:Late blight resistance protein homolog R1B-12 n=1 Tax=Olea europaea subsp. europaea TaxID=158383 RepID=A0A8S0TVZ4_OLEEU|nr:Putative late blight resistance protein homolog R1B-12 [Olea europaea subsp. europaea]